MLILPTHFILNVYYVEHSLLKLDTIPVFDFFLDDLDVYTAENT